MMFKKYERPCLLSACDCTEFADVPNSFLAALQVLCNHVTRTDSEQSCITDSSGLALAIERLLILPPSHLLPFSSPSELANHPRRPQPGSLHSIEPCGVQSTWYRLRAGPHQAPAAPRSTGAEARRARLAPASPRPGAAGP